MFSFNVCSLSLGSPSAEPSEEPSPSPTKLPTVKPTKDPSAGPTSSPSAEPSDEPSTSPSTNPSAQPSSKPSVSPSKDPSSTPTDAPTDDPTVAPTFAKCDTDDALNIAFLMDESGSVDSDEWDIIVNFVDRIATFDVAGPSYVSLFEYASLPAFQQFLDWTPIETGEESVTLALNMNNYNSAGLTFTWDAVNRVLDEFWSYRKNCTDGCETRHDILFLLTDGAPTDDVCPDMVERANTTTVDIVIIGIGTSADAADGWMSQIDCLDIADGKTDIYYVEEFESGDFNEIEGVIRNYTCNGENPASEGDRGGDPWVYEDGSTSLGPVPTTDGSGNAPADSTPSPVASSRTILVPAGEEAPVTFMGQLGRSLNIPDQLPTSSVIMVASLLSLAYALYRCGFRCGCWREETKSYKRVNFSAEMPSDSEDDIAVAVPMKL